MVAAALTGPGIAARAPHAGRCNLYATQRGLVTVDAESSTASMPSTRP
jgi:hypothetical protein